MTNIYSVVFLWVRRVLEMCCFMEKMLANLLTDFEMKLEREVLEPLNKLSEVRRASSQLPVFTLHLSIIHKLKVKITLAKLFSLGETMRIF